jgi:SAM-dependent methyltransferase
MQSSSKNQRAQFERLHSIYAAHYNDDTSLGYRKEFIFKPLIESAAVDLQGCRVADLACGSGYNSVILQERFPGVQCTGFDISPSACADFRSVTGCAAYELDLTKPIDAKAYGAPFDVAVVVGGLHHCVVDLPRAIKNVASLLRPGGVFLMTEPNSRYALEGVRRLWYRLDDKNFDAASEQALNHAALAEQAARQFRVRSVRYLGGPAYFLVLNSMMTRVPLWMKPAIRAYSRIPSPWFHAFWIAAWERL